jgi:hypothetical protein
MTADIKTVLPPLPEPFAGCAGVWPEYTADQMREYAEAAVLSAIDSERKEEDEQVREAVLVPSEWLKPGAVVPVTPETVGLLLRALQSATPAEPVPAQAMQIALDNWLRNGGGQYFDGDGPAEGFRDGWNAALAASTIQPKE